MRSYDSRRARAGNLANVEIRIPNDESMAECSNDDFRNAMNAADARRWPSFGHSIIDSTFDIRHSEF
jgi:hypothetical protein